MKPPRIRDQSLAAVAFPLRLLLMALCIILPAGVLLVVAPVLVHLFMFIVLMPWGWPIAAIVVFVVGKRLLSRQGFDYTYGSARLASRFDLQAAALLTEQGLILGRALPERPPFFAALGYLFRAPWQDSCEACRYFFAAVIGAFLSGRPLVRASQYVHLCTIAPAGAGKNVGQIIPTLLTHPGSVFITDPKGENYTKSADRRRQFGAVYRIDPFHICGQEADQFNPLDLLNPQSPGFINDVRALAEALVVRNADEKDPHWSDCAVDAITAVIAYVASTSAPKGEKTLLTVRRLIADELAFVGALADMRHSAVAGGALQTLASQIGRWADKELSSIISTTNRHLSFLDSPLVSHCLARSSFDPAELVQRPMSVYYCLPPAQLQPLARLTRLIMTSCFARLSQGPLQEERTVLFLLDEVASALGGPAPFLEQAITLLRGYGIRIWLCLQSISQLHKLFPDGKGFQTVQANMGHQIFFGIRDLESAQYVSACLGQTTVETVTTQTSSGFSRNSLAGLMAGGQLNESVSTGNSISRSTTGRALLQPEEILRLPETIALVLAKGVDPFACRVIRYYSDEAFQTEPVEESDDARVVAPPAAKQHAAASSSSEHRLLPCPNPSCRQVIRYPIANVGKETTCPSCAQRFTLRRREREHRVVS